MPWRWQRQAKAEEGVQFIHDHLEAALLLIVVVSVLPMVVEWWRHRRAAASSASKLAQADSAKIE